MAIIPKGKEPAKVKKRIDTLFPKLDEAYPDKVIVGLQRDHKKWDETAREISKQLGYESKNDFLTSYGYKIEKLSGGRPKSTNADSIIEELKRRYPNGSSFSKIEELKNDNPDLAPSFKSLANQSNELFGMTFVKYLKSIGVLKESACAQDKIVTTEGKVAKELFIRKKLIEKAKIDFERYSKFENKELKIIKEKLEKKNRTGEDYVITINKVKYWTRIPVCKGQVVKIQDSEGEKYIVVENYSIRSWQSLKNDYPVMFPRKIKAIVNDNEGMNIADNMLVKSFIQDKEVTVPEGIEIICKQAFLSNPYISKINLPGTLTTIEEDAFAGCVGLSEITLPNSIRFIGDGAFSDCISLERITIPNNTGYIGQNIFTNCLSLKEITIPHWLVSTIDIQNLDGLKKIFYVLHSKNSSTKFDNTSVEYIPINESINYNKTRKTVKFVEIPAPNPTKNITSKLPEYIDYNYILAKEMGHEGKLIDSLRMKVQPEDLVTAVFKGPKEDIDQVAARIADYKCKNWSRPFESNKNILPKECNDGFWEIADSTIKCKILERIAFEYPSLKIIVSAFGVHFMYSYMIVFYSESGYTSFSSPELAGTDATESEFPWMLDVNLLEDFKGATCDGESVEYNCPFKKQWYKNNFIIEINGKYYQSGRQQ